MIMCMENKDYNRELAKYIWSVLRMQIAIFISWGVNPESMKVIEGGLEFHCLGFKHTGTVRIILDEGADLFEIHRRRLCRHARFCDRRECGENGRL